MMVSLVVASLMETVVVLTVGIVDVALVFVEICFAWFFVISSVNALGFYGSHDYDPASADKGGGASPS